MDLAMQISKEYDIIFVIIVIAISFTAASWALYKFKKLVDELERGT